MKPFYYILLFGCVLLFDAHAQDIPVFPRAETLNQKKQEPDIEKLAAEYVRNRDFEKAVVLYEKLFEEKTTHFYYNYYIYCLIELQDYKTALKAVNKMQKSDQNRLRYDVDEGYIYNISGDLTKATKIFDKALESVQPVATQIRDLANAFNYRGQTEYAIRTYLKGREMLPDQPFNLDLASIYQRIERYDEMVNEYLNLLDIDLTKMDVVRTRLQSVMENDPDGEKNEILRKELLRRIQRSPEKTYFSEMLIWQSVQQRDFEMALIQARSLDRRLQEQGSRIYDLALLCLSNEAFDVAIDAYNYLLEKGTNSPFYLDSRIGLLNAKYLKVINRYDYSQNDLLDLENEYSKALNEFGQNSSTVPVMRYMAHLQAFYLDNTDYAIDLLEKAVEMPAVTPAMKAECKIELADILLFSGNVWDATLLYSQVDYDFKHDPIGHQAKFKNAKLSYYIGEFAWAKAQLDVLKAATSKLISNDAMELSLIISDNIDLDSTYTALSIFSRAELLIYRNSYDQAIATLDSIQMLSLYHSLNDDVLYRKAEIMLKKGNFTEADTLLAKVVAMYPLDLLADDALWLRAQLHETHFNDIVKAKEFYEKILFDYPGSLYTVEARKRFRTLRGDMTN
ncbi:MAG: tetratricopeptide repeat protein [Bacteroidales bacterium]|nr:tetratricopeptide repeat protein [Bacteroidales bacterium]